MPDVISRPKNRSRRSVLHTTVLGLLVNGLMYLFLYLGQILVIRGISRAEYSVFVVSVSFVALAALFSDLGLTSLFIKMFAEAEERHELGHPDRRGEILGTVMVLRGSTSALVGLFVFVMPPFLGYDAQTVGVMRILIVSIVISPRLLTFRNVADLFVLARGRYVLSSSLALLDSILFAGALLWLSHTGISLLGATIVYVGCSIPSFLLVSMLLTRWSVTESMRLRFSTSVLRTILSNALPFLIGTAFITLFNNLDPILLDQWSTREQVSAFGASMRIVTAIGVLPFVLVNVVAPEVARRLVRDDERSVHALVHSVFRMLLFFAGAVALLLSSAPHLVTRLILGSGYADASTLLIYLGWSFVPLAFVTLLAEISIAGGSLWSPALVRGVMMIVTLVGDVLLIRSNGATGSMIARTVGLTLASVSFAILLPRMRAVNERTFYRLLGTWLFCAGASAALIATFRWLFDQEYAVALCVVASYVALHVVTRLLTRHDLSLLRSYLRRNPTLMIVEEP